MQQPAREHGLKGIFGNIVWLLGGKTFGAVCSIGYLAILSRSLGIRDFGHFSLIFGTALALVSLTGVRTWQTVARYGANYAAEGRWDRFGRLTMLCGLVDSLGSALGCGVAAIAFYGFAGTLELNPDYIDMGFAFACAILWARVAAPFGVLRVLGRFDLNVAVGATVPLGRLVAAVAIWTTGPSVGRYLFAWAAIDLLSAVLFWATARYSCPQGVRLRYVRDWRQALQENERIVRFLAITYVSASISALQNYGPLLAIGYFLGTSAAGLYRLADQVAQGVGKVATLVAQAIYSDIAKSQASDSHAGFSRLVRRVGIVSGIAGLLVMVLALIGGDFLIGLIGGADFEPAATVLLPLLIAASFGLASVAFEPALHSIGHAHYALVARLIALTALTAAFAILIGQGALGAGWAVAIGGGVGYLTIGLLSWIAMRRTDGR